MSKCEHGERITRFCMGEQCRHRQAGGCDYCIKKHHFHLANAPLLAEHDLEVILHTLTLSPDAKFKNRALIELATEYLGAVRQACGNWLDQAQTAVSERLSFPLLRREGLLPTYQRIKNKDYRRLNAQDLRAIHEFAVSTPPETYKRQQLAAYFVEVEQAAIILHAAEGLAHALERLPALGQDLPAPTVPSFGTRLHEIIAEILREKGKQDGHSQLPREPLFNKTESSKLQELMKESSLLKNRISRELSQKQQREGRQEDAKRGSTPGKEPFLESIHKRQSSNGIGKEPLVSPNNKEEHLELPPIHADDKKKRNRRASIDDKLEMKFGACDREKQVELKKKQALEFIFPHEEGLEMGELQNDLIPAPPPSMPYDQSEVKNKVVKIPILMPKSTHPFDDGIDSPIFKTKRKQARYNTMEAPLKELPLTEVVQVQREDSERQIASEPTKKQQTQEFVLQASEKYSLLLFSQALKSDSERAIDLLVAALKYSPNNLSAAEYLSFLYLQSGLAKECLEVCEAILNRIANRGDQFQVTLHLHNNRAAALNMLGRYSESIVILEKCLKYRRKHYFYKNLADAYFSLGIPEKAAMNYEKAVRLDPAYDEAYYNLGVCEFMQSEYVSAQLNVEQALRIDPANETYLQLKAQITTKIGNCLQ